MTATAQSAEATETIRNFYATVDRQPHDRSALERFFAADFKDNNRPLAPKEVSDRDVIVGLLDQLNHGFPSAKHDLLIVEPISDNRAVYWKSPASSPGPSMICQLQASRCRSMAWTYSE